MRSLFTAPPRRRVPGSALAVALAWNWNSFGWGWDRYFSGTDAAGPAGVASSPRFPAAALNGTLGQAVAAEPATRTAAVAAFAARYYNGVPGDRDLWEEERVVEPVYRRREIQVDHSCAVDDPVVPFPPQGINPVEFWAVWEGWWFFEQDHYRFTATARDGVRLYVDGALIVDEWTVKAASEATSALKALHRGRHLVRIEYFTRAARRTGALPAIPEATPVSTWRDTARDFSRCKLRVRWERDPYRLKMSAGSPTLPPPWSPRLTPRTLLRSFVYDLPPRFHVGVAVRHSLSTRYNPPRPPRPAAHALKRPSSASLHPPCAQEKNPKCESHMFAAEVRMYENILRSAARTLDAEAADFYYVPVFSSCKYLPEVRPRDPPRPHEHARTHLLTAAPLTSLEPCSPSSPPPPLCVYVCACVLKCAASPTSVWTPGSGRSRSTAPSATSSGGRIGRGRRATTTFSPSPTTTARASSIRRTRRTRGA